MKKLFTLIALIVFCEFKAQPIVDSIPIAGNWSSFYISDVLLDQQQQIWITYKGTNINTSGIKKFDGANWTQYQTSNSGLPSNKISCIKQDASNNYWIGTNAGLAKFDGTNWMVFNMTNSLIPNDTVNDLIIDADTLWLATNNGVSKFHNNSWQNYTAQNSALNTRESYSLLKANNKLYIGHKNNISVLSSNGITNYLPVDASIPGYVNKIINNPFFGIVFSCASGIYQLNDGNYRNMENEFKLCPDALNPGLMNYPKHFKQIANNLNGSLLINAIDPLNSTHANSFTQFKPNEYLSHDFIISSSYLLSYISMQENKLIFILRFNLGQSVILIVDPNQLGGQFQSSFYLDKNCNQSKLDVNQVSARMLNSGDMFWDLNSNPGYEVPKGSGSYAGFAGSIWIGGRVNNQLRTACMTYRQNGLDFWPGPLDTTDALNAQSAGQIGGIIKVNRNDINEFIYNYNNGSVQNGTFRPSSGIMFWPAHDTGNFSRKKANFVDVNQNGIYDPLVGGDYPQIKGDQMLYNIYNDASGPHLESGSPNPMGLEIHQSSYAYSCNDIDDTLKALNYTTFYEFEFINRSDTLIDSAYVGFWNDTDLGNYQDDFIGCNVKENYGFIYNGDPFDDDGNGVIGYKDYLPCFSTAIIQSPKAINGDGKDNDHNGLTDEQDEQVGMSSFIMIVNNSSATNGNPDSSGQGIQYYRYLMGKWKDGAAIKYGTDGVSGTLPTSFMYPGSSDPIGYGLGGSVNNPITQNEWTEENGGNVPGDRRFLINSGPFRIAPKDTAKITYAFVFSIDSSVTGNIMHNVIKSEQDVKRIKQWHKNNQLTSCSTFNPVNINTINDKRTFVKTYPNPLHDYFVLECATPSNYKIEIYDVLGNTVLIDNIKGSTHVIDSRLLASGIYFVKVSDGNQQQIIKIIKQ